MLPGKKENSVSWFQQPQLKMSIYYSGALKRSGGIVSAISKQVKLINLKGVKRIQITFDPFAENVKSAR